MPIIFNKENFIKDKCKDKNVLDVGCVNHTVDATHDPRWQHAIIKSTARSLIGLDYEATAVAALIQRGFNVICADAQNFDIRQSYPNGFQVVVASEIIEHLINPGLFFDCISKHLANDGILILTTPNPGSLFNFLQTAIFNEERCNDDHTISFTLKNLSQILKRCGLAVVENHWFVRDSSYAHKGVSKVAMLLVYWLQMMCVFLRPGLAKEIILVVKKV